MAHEIEINNDNFAIEVLQSDVPVLVDFWAPWCVPCRMVAPVLEEISGEYEGKLKVAKVNVDEAGEIAGKYSIISIPTLMVFKGGEVVNQQVGAGSKPAIEALFKDFI